MSGYQTAAHCSPLTTSVTKSSINLSYSQPRSHPPTKNTPPSPAASLLSHKVKVTDSLSTSCAQYFKKITQHIIEACKDIPLFNCMHGHLYASVSRPTAVLKDTFPWIPYYLTPMCKKLHTVLGCSTMAGSAFWKRKLNPSLHSNGSLFFFF